MCRKWNNLYMAGLIRIYRNLELINEDEIVWYFQFLVGVLHVSFR